MKKKKSKKKIIIGAAAVLVVAGDYDAVIIGHSQFEKIPLSAERQERYLVPPKLVPVFKPGTTVKNRLKELGDHE